MNKNADWSEDRKFQKVMFMLSEARLKNNLRKLKIGTIKFIAKLINYMLGPPNLRIVGEWGL